MKFSRSFFIVFLVLIFNISVIYADEQTNIESKSQTNIESDQQDESNLAKKESLKQQCKELLDDIVEETVAFRDEVAQFDDITLLITKIL